MTAQHALLANVLLFAILAIHTVYLAGKTNHVRFAVIAGVCACLSLVTMVYLGGVV